MKTQIDKKRFGPWALVTGASSGISKEFARQIAASGINVVLVARRESLLDEVGQVLAKDFKVQYRTVVADLSQEGFLDKLAEATNDLDIGLVVDAGTPNPGEFLKLDRQLLQATCRPCRWQSTGFTSMFTCPTCRRWEPWWGTCAARAVNRCRLSSA
jgi:uncharacterized protein